MTLCVFETHPIQYHAPVWRTLARDRGVPLKVFYGSDRSVRGYLDPEFGVHLAWDGDLMEGYESAVLEREGVKRRSPREVLEAESPSAVLCVGYSGGFHLRALYAAVRSGAPILFRAETSDPARDRSASRAIARDAALRALYARCDELLYIGEASRAHYARLGVPAGKLVFSPYCVDENVFEPAEEGRSRYREAARSAIGAAPDDFVVLFSGKLSDRKAPDLLLDAVSGRPDVIVLFVGDGVLLPELERQARRLGVRTHFTGFVPQRKLSGWFHAADVLCLPSRQGETWGLVVNEALLHGIPVVVSDGVGCHPDLVTPGVTGFVARIGDAEHLGRMLAKSRELQGGSIRDGCRARAAAYSTRRAAAGIAEAYGRVTERCAFST